MSQRISGYVNIQPQTWLQFIGNAATLIASVTTLSFTFAVFLGWIVQVIPNINTLFDRTNTLNDLVATPGGPLYVNGATDAVTIGCNGSSIELCYFLHNLNLTAFGYTNNASFMSGVTNGKDSLDALVVHDQLQDTQITNLNTTVNNLASVTLSTLNYTNNASFMSGVTNGKQGLDALVVNDQTLEASMTAQNAILQTKIDNLNNTLTYGNISTLIVFDPYLGSFQYAINNQTRVQIDALFTLISNIGNNSVNGTILSNQVFDVPRSKNQQLVNDELYANDASINATASAASSTASAANATANVATVTASAANATANAASATASAANATSNTALAIALAAQQNQYSLVNFNRIGSTSSGLQQCGFTIDLTSGQQYVTGSSVFQYGSSGMLVYNGSATQAFYLHFSADISYMANVTSSILYFQTTITRNNNSVAVVKDNRLVELTSGTLSHEFNLPIFLNMGNTLGFSTLVSTQSGSIYFSGCSIDATQRLPSISIIPFATTAVTAPALSPAMSTVSGAGSSYQNYYAHFTLTTRDQYGNTFYSPSATIAATVTVGVTVFNVTVSSNGDGTYNCTYLATVSGTGVLAATINGVAMVNPVPGNINVIASVHAPFCSLASSTTEPVGPIVWTFTMLDINAQVVTDFHDNFILQITNSYLAAGIIFQQQSPGVGQLAFYAGEIGTMEFEVNVINDVNTLTMAGTPSYTVFS